VRVGSGAPRVHPLLRHDGLRAQLRERLQALAAAGVGASTRVCRILLLDEPPSLDANEITDKGYINQRAVLACRAEAVEALYAAEPGPEVILCR
jgi:feruloyl-CoA synthase